MISSKTGPDRPDIRVYGTVRDLAVSAADLLMAQARAAVEEKGVFTLVLSGGSTPSHLYAVLTDPGRDYLHGIPWDRIQFFWGDERHVPPDHPDSNYGLADRELLSKIPLKPDQIIRMMTEWPDPQQIAADYETRIRTSFSMDKTGTPDFDMVFLGLGEDAHTASLFPGYPEILASLRLVESVRVEKLESNRITMTPRLLNAARLIVFLATGISKVTAMGSVHSAPYSPETHPAQIIQSVSGNVIWMIDSEAAAGLSR